MIMFSSVAQKRPLLKLSIDYATTFRGDKFCNYSITVPKLEARICGISLLFDNVL